MIYIIQCLCPNRHAIFAIAYDPDILPAREAGLNPHELHMAMFQQQVEKWIEEKKINPWCGICNSRDWTYEQRRTKYKTMEEAKREMSQLEVENMLTRLMIEQRKAEKN